jgi:hypothetical protein
MCEWSLFMGVERENDLICALRGGWVFHVSEEILCLKKKEDCAFTTDTMGTH